jgi:hypothetical protein
MVRETYHRSSLPAERSYLDGNESAATSSISGALGMSQASWIKQADTMSDWAVESIQEVVSEMNKAERVLFPMCNVLIDGREH